MNNFHYALNQCLERDSGKLELISKGVNKLRAIYNGVVYENYSELPKTARFAIARCIQPHYDDYTMLREKYDQMEAEERLCWCLFGSFDGQSDIDVRLCRGKCEIPSHCKVCQYEKPFCKKVIVGLSPREQECILLMREGMTDKEVALRMGISYLTVIKHMNNAVQRFRDITGRNITRQYLINQLSIAGI